MRSIVLQKSKNENNVLNGFNIKKSTNLQQDLKEEKEKQRQKKKRVHTHDKGGGDVYVEEGGCLREDGGPPQQSVRFSSILFGYCAFLYFDFPQTINIILN
jgi:hypothetical protein